MTFARYLLGMLLVLVWHAQAPAGFAQGAGLRVLDRRGESVAAFTDGDLIRLEVRLDESVAAPTTVDFGLDDARRSDATCTIASGDSGCTTAAFRAFGWYWNASRQPQPRRVLHAAVSDVSVASTEITVAPRPVVLVHGFISGAAAWQEYTRPDGFLASLGLDGYAVGDGQAPGVMLTGDVQQPTLATNSIAQNAAILAQYIGSVKQRTGAEHVDLVAHSLGGLISRYYIDRLMPERDVAQLLMLGTAHGGSPCAQLPASLGWYLPASLELRPAYVGEIFNRQITRRNGVPFYQMAGTSIVDELRSPCTVVPSDLVVDRASVSSISAPLTELPELHTSLNASAQTFSAFVAPRLQTEAGGFPSPSDPPLPQATARQLQFTKLVSGLIAAGESRELTIDLDQVAVASFALFDPTRSLTVQVRGASGAIITLDPETNGMVSFDDPSALVNLGYGFTNPAPGPWRITLTTTPATPPEGAPYAISTKVVGGATLYSGIDQTVPQLNETVVLSASLELASRQLADASIEATIRAPDGTVEQLALSGDQAVKQANLTPRQSGMYTLDLAAQGSAEDGTPVERTAFLAFEVQPEPAVGRRSLLLIQAGGLVVLVGLVLWFVLRRQRRTRRSAPKRA